MPIGLSTALTTSAGEFGEAHYIKFWRRKLRGAGVQLAEGRAYCKRKPTELEVSWKVRSSTVRATWGLSQELNIALVAV